MLLERPGHCVVLAVRLQRSGTHPLRVGVGPAEAAKVDHPQVVWGSSVVHPLGQCLAGTTTGSDSECVEACTDVEVAQFGRLAENEVAIGCEALWAVDERANTGVGQLRNSADSQLHDRREVIEVALEQLKLERARNPVDCPWNRVRLVAAHHQTADLLLVVRQAVRVAQRRQVAGYLRRELLGDHVLVLHRHERNIHPDRRAERTGPLPTADDDLLALDPAPAAVGRRRQYSLDDAAFHLDAEHLCVFADGGAVHARAASQCHRDVAGVGLPVGGQKGSANNVVDLHQRPQRLRFLWRQQMHLQAEALRRRGLALHFSPALLVARQAQPAVHLPAGGLAGLGLERLVQLHRVAEQLGDVGAGAQLADQASCVEGAAGGELVLLEQHRVGPAQLCKVVGRRAADDAAADDDSASVGGERWKW